MCTDILQNETAVSITSSCQYWVEYVDLMLMGKCVHLGVILLNVSVHKWLCHCLSIKESVSRSCDLPFLKVMGKCFVTNTININTYFYYKH